MAEVLVAYLHYSAMILIAVFLAIEYLICPPGLSRERIVLLARLGPVAGRSRPTTKQRVHAAMFLPDSFSSLSFP